MRGSNPMPNKTTPDDDWLYDVLDTLSVGSYYKGKGNKSINLVDLNDTARAAINAKITELLVAERAKHYQAIKSGRPAQKYPDDGNGDEDNQNLGWNDCRTAYDAVVDEVFKGDKLNLELNKEK